MKYVNKIKEWLKRFALIIATICIICICAYIPFIIDELTRKYPYCLSFSKSDLLYFWGSFLAFVGTVILGLVAWGQNEKSNKINERLLSLEEQKNQPFVHITNWKIISEEYLNVIFDTGYIAFQIEKKELNEMFVACLALEFTNTSSTYGEVSYSGAKVYSNDTYIEDWGNIITNRQNAKLYLQSGETGDIVFYCSKEKMKNFLSKKIKLELIIKNSFSHAYKETIDIIICNVGISGMEDKEIERWFLDISPQNYQIKKL